MRDVFGVEKLRFGPYARHFRGNTLSIMSVDNCVHPLEEQVFPTKEIPCR